MKSEKQKFRDILNQKLSTGKPFDILMCNEVIDEYFDLALSEKEEECKWINVEEKLPENGKQILALRDFGDHQIMEVAHFDHHWYKMNCITYWQPLPTPPSTNNKK